MTESTKGRHSPTDHGPLGRIDVVIPALNEESSLPLVLAELPAIRHVYVVDNRSTDDTAKVAAAAGAIVVRENQRGYGKACLAGLQAIRDSIGDGEPAPEVVAFVDADYSDHPDELVFLTDPIFSNQADFVLGSRLLGQREPGAMPPQAIYGNHLACFLMRLFFGHRFTDLGPFRAIRWTDLESLAMEDEDYGWTIEMQIKAVKAGLRIREVPVSYRKRIGTSKISGTISGTFKAGTKILATIAKYGFSTGRKISAPVQLPTPSTTIMPVSTKATHEAA